MLCYKDAYHNFIYNIVLHRTMMMMMCQHLHKRLQNSNNSSSTTVAAVQQQHLSVHQSVAAAA
jgi:hypothetical protein